MNFVLLFYVDIVLPRSFLDWFYQFLFEFEHFLWTYVKRGKKFNLSYWHIDQAGNYSVDRLPEDRAALIEDGPVNGREINSRALNA